MRLKEKAHEERSSFKQVVNDAIRRGIEDAPEAGPFTQPSFSLGAPRVDLTKAGRIDDERFPPGDRQSPRD